MSSVAIHAEHAHQTALMQAVFNRSDVLNGMHAPNEAGLAAYRNNGSANAARALAVMFPAVHALLGEDDFYPLARLHWLATPPTKGDWSQYGSDFGTWITHANPGGVLEALPFLADLTALDDALSRCQDAANGATDLSTLAMLEQDPSTLRMHLCPSVAVLSLNYDVLAFRQAVLDKTPLTAPLLTFTHVLIARHHWRAKAQGIDAATATFIQHCLNGTSLLQAHEAAVTVDAHFDVSAWLNQAIAAQWLMRVEAL